VVGGDGGRGGRGGGEGGRSLGVVGGDRGRDLVSRSQLRREVRGRREGGGREGGGRVPGRCEGKISGVLETARFKNSMVLLD
jgi:hypothetical protein